MQRKKFPCRRDGQHKGSKEEVCLAILRKSWRPGWLDWGEEGESSRRWSQGGNRRADCLDLRTIMTPRIFTLRERGFQAVEWHNLISIWEQWQSIRLFCDEQMGKEEFRRPHQEATGGTWWGMMVMEVGVVIRRGNGDRLQAGDLLADGTGMRNVKERSQGWPQGCRPEQVGLLLTDRKRTVDQTG